MENSEFTIDQAMKKVDTIDDQIKYKAFGKTRISYNKATIKKEPKKDVDSSDVALLKRQSQRMEEQILKIKSKNQGRAVNVFKMKDIIMGSKKGGQEATAIQDPKTGDLVVANEQIKEVTLTYCVDNLKKQYDKDQYNLKKMLHELRMEDDNDIGFEIEECDFDEVLEKFKSKSTKSYDFLLKAGKNYQEVMFQLCKRMIDGEDFPTSFRRTILYMIWKQKGPAEILKNNRFIHLKESFLPRTCEAMVVGKMKNCILQSSSIF